MSMIIPSITKIPLNFYLFHHYYIVESKLIMEARKRQIVLNNTHLKNIAEVTQEYNSSIKRDETPSKQQDGIEKIEFKRNLMKQYTNCLEYLFSFCKKPKKLEYDINESEITKEVEKLKKRKSKVEPLIPPPPSSKTKTLVLDLDETLLHSSFKKTKNYDFAIEIDIKGSLEKIYITKRFGLDIFLFEMSQIFQIVLFTAGLREYTDEVLKQIDPKKRIKHVLYREHCTILNKSYFLKNLKLLGRNLKQTILVDDNSMAGMMNYEIFYKIDPFYGDHKDRKLLRLIEFLKLMSEQANFECLLEKRKQFESKNTRPTCFFNHNLQVKPTALQNESTEQSTEQSTVSRQQNTAIELVKNLEM